MKEGLLNPAVIALTVMSFFMGTSEFIIVGILPDISGDMGIPYHTVGALVSIFAIGYAVMTPLITSATGQMNRFRLMMVLMACFVLADLLTLFSWDYASLALSRVVTAAICGSLLSVGMTFVMDVVAPRYRPKAVSLVYAGFSMASIFGLPIGTTISHLFGWRSVFVFVLFVSLAVWAMLVRTLPRESSLVRDAGERDRGVFRDPRIITGILIVVCIAAGTYVLYTYLAPLIQDGVGLDDAGLSAALMVFGVCCLTSTITSGKIAERGGFRLLRFLFLLQAGAYTLVTLFMGQPVLLFIGLMMYGVTMNFVNSSSQINFLEIAKNDHPRSVNLCSSLNPVSYNIGVAIGSLVGGFLYDSFGLEYLGVGGAVIIVGASLFAFIMCRLGKAPGKATSMM